MRFLIRKGLNEQIAYFYAPVSVDIGGVFNSWSEIRYYIVIVTRACEMGDKLAINLMQPAI